MTLTRIIPEMAVRHQYPLERSEKSPVFFNGIDEQIRASKARMRKRWLVRTTLMLVTAAAIICFLVTWQRDQITKTETLDTLVPACAALQAKLDKWSQLPATLPELKRGFYITDDVRAYAKHTSEPVIIAGLGRTSLVLRTDGRCVIIYQEGKVRRDWITLKEFEARWEEQQHKVKAFQHAWDTRPPELP